MKKVAIVQSNYIPWKGYFDLIAAVEAICFPQEKVLALMILDFLAFRLSLTP